MDPNLWGTLPSDLLEHIARFADIDTRRAMGFKPGKLRPSNIVIKPGTKWYNAGFPYTMVCLTETVQVVSNWSGEIFWIFWKYNDEKRKFDRCVYETIRS
jgi:hypothetical protein